MKFIFTLLVSFLFMQQSLQAQWTKTNGPKGITIEAFFNKGNLLFAGTKPKGIYKSINHGLNWTESNSPSTKHLDITCFASDDLYLYAGSLDSGVYRSPDDGITWQHANNGLVIQGVNCLLVANGYLFAGTVLNGMYRSSDHGATWIEINGGGLLDLSYILAMVYQNNRLIVEADNYLFFSDDNGLSWDTDQASTAFYQIDNFFQHGDTLLASAGVALFRSVDGGVNWSNVQILNVSLCGFDHVADTIYAGYRNGVLRSTDWGLTWTTISSVNLRSGTRFQNDFKISAGNFLLGYEEIGPYVSKTKGLNWLQSDLYEFAVSSTVDDAVITHNGNLYSGTHSDGVYKSPDKGISWSRLGTPVDTDTLSNAIIFSMLHYGTNVLLAGTCGNGLYRSGDNGNTWTHITAGLPQQAGTGFTCIRSLAVCGPNILAALNNSVCYSSDSGLTWHTSAIAGGITVLEASGFAIRNNIACVGIIASPGRGIYRSTDNGVSFSLADGLLDIIKIKEGGGSNMYAGTDFSVAMSIDDGLTWGGVGPGIPPSGGAFTIMAWDHNVFIGNNFGVFFSGNDGASFTDISQGFPLYPHRVILGLSRDEQFLYAGTEEDGVWRRPLSEIITVVPVTMGQLKAGYDGRNGILTWETFTESNVSHFEIERSTDGKEFTKIGTVTATGNSSTEKNYRFDDKEIVPGFIYYRLKIKDIDGKFTYSNIAAIRVIMDGIVQLFPNPFADNITITLNASQPQQVNFRLINAGGQLLRQGQRLVSAGMSKLTIQDLGMLGSGVYVLEIAINEKQHSFRVVK